MTEGPVIPVSPSLPGCGPAVLRGLAAKDADVLVSLFAEPSVQTYVRGAGTLKDVAAAEKWIRQRRYRGRPGFYLGVYAEGDLSGAIGLSGLSYSLSYFIGEQFQGKGLGSAAVRAFCDFCLDELGVPYLSAYVDETNDASARLLKRIGFLHAGYETSPEGAPLMRFLLERGPTGL